MKTTILNLILGSLLFLTLVLHLVTRPDPARRNFEIMPDMAESVPYEAQGANDNFPDGQNLRSPVPGTIARGFLPLRYAATPEDALRAGEELTNPYEASDQKALARGEFVYETFCLVCHGAGGLGDGVLTTRGVPPPPSLAAEHALDMKDGQMFHVVTYGQGNMPSYASQVEREDRWKAILHIRALQGTKP